MKVATFDIETFPLLAYSWGPKWEANLLEIEQDITLAGFAVKPLGKGVKVYAQPDFKTYKQLVKALWDVFNEYDVLIAHNGKSFDIKQSNAFFVKEGLPVPSPYRLIDTKLEARKYFRLSSNSLNDLGRYFELGQKVETGGYSLWVDCRNGNPKAWAKMKKYNKQDVVLLEAIYLKMLPWMKNHPDNTLFTKEGGCPRCHSHNVQSRGMQARAEGKVKGYNCNDCGKRSYTAVLEPWPRCPQVQKVEKAGK